MSVEEVQTLDDLDTGDDVAPTERPRPTSGASEGTVRKIKIAKTASEEAVLSSDIPGDIECEDFVMDIDMLECKPEPREPKTNSTATAPPAAPPGAPTAIPATAKKQLEPQLAPTGGRTLDLDESLDELPELPSISSVSASPPKSPVPRGFHEFDAPGTLWGTTRKSDPHARGSGGEPVDAVEIEELEELPGPALGSPSRTPGRAPRAPSSNPEPTGEQIQRLSVEDEMEGDFIPELGGDDIPELGGDHRPVDAPSPQRAQAPVRTPEMGAPQLATSNKISPREVGAEGASAASVQPSPQQGDNAESFARSSASAVPVEDGALAAQEDDGTSLSGQNKSGKEGKGGRLRFGRRA